MSKDQKWNGGDKTPKAFTGKAPSNPVPKGIGNNDNGSSRGKQGKS